MTRDRAVSTTLSYVLALTVATLLVGGLILAGSTFVEDRRDTVIEQELRVVGEHLASNVEQVDRYARAADDVDAARVSQTYPASVTHASYTVRLRDGDPPQLLLNASNPGVRVTVNVSVDPSQVSESVANGGRIAAVCDTTGSSCEVTIEND